MFYRFNFVEERSLLKVMVYGTADVQSMRSRIVLLANDHRWKPEYKLLVDYSNVTVIHAPQEFCNTLKDLLNEVPADRLPVGMAYVFPERLFCQCFDPQQPAPSIDARCKVGFFKEEEAAMDWLEKLAAENLAAKASS